MQNPDRKGTKARVGRNDVSPYQVILVGNLLQSNRYANTEIFKGTCLCQINSDVASEYWAAGTERK
jgi:hypothetical protein